jgi:hypothetical protein
MLHEFVSTVRSAARKQILYLPHTVEAMSAVDEMVTPDEVRAVILDGEVIEDYREDPLGHSCLMLGFGAESRPIHVVCSPKDDYLVIITVYVPDTSRWHADWKRRRAQ